jgi:hypothetical protein
MGVRIRGLDIKAGAAKLKADRAARAEANRGHDAIKTVRPERVATQIGRCVRFLPRSRLARNSIRPPAPSHVCCVGRRSDESDNFLLFFFNLSALFRVLSNYIRSRSNGRGTVEKLLGVSRQQNPDLLFRTFLGYLIRAAKAD